MMHGNQRAVTPASQLRVLILNSLLDGGGIDSHTLSLCRALQLQGCEVTLAAPHGARWIAAAREMQGICLLELNAKRIAWPEILARHLRERQMHVIHAHHGRDYWVAILAWILSGRKAAVVVTRHLMTSLKERTRRYLAASSSVIAVSDAVQNALRLVDPDRTLKLRRIYCGIDTERFRACTAERHRVRRALGVPHEAWIYALIGGAQKPDGKGQSYFVKAAAQVFERHPQSHFLCVGDGDLTPQLRREANSLGLDRNFHFRPFEHDVASLMQAIDVLVHPPVGSEALGLVILEALSCGKPVVATSLDGIPETFIDGDHGVLVPPRDANALAVAMSRLAADPRRAARMGSRGRLWVEANFSLASLGRETVQLYQDCLSGARHRQHRAS
ncbi:glycosyltransferase family 4 protein [Cupriavidus basilensis]|uniref:Glycosyltransferase family 4 protein n=1 Tax=Cupriavidus basilensis TaxID=68895 RepID=A0ABT6ALS7_9BURK|nr:glycosyltransferase family 4 protein [Cupriavidus basilensis]MDF3833277.1 glycosyltransferase family 4 protein [Cupriavidus basilensis]